MNFPADSNRYRKKKDIVKNVIVLKIMMQFHERSNYFFTFGKSSFLLFSVFVLLSCSFMMNGKGIKIM